LQNVREGGDEAGMGDKKRIFYFEKPDGMRPVE